MKSARKLKRTPPTSLTPTEDTIHALLKEGGWEIFRNGWPDFFCRQQAPDGSWLPMAIEVKDVRDSVSHVQDKMHQALAAVGIPVYVVDHARELSKIQRDQYRRWRENTHAVSIREHPEEDEWIG